MMEHERLKENIEILYMHNELHTSVMKLTDYKKPETDLIREIVSDCREIINKIEQGTLIELPCKVGDTIYVPWHYDGARGVSFHVVQEIFITGADCYLRFEVDTDVEYVLEEIYCDGIFSFSSFGRRFFLTREEAENA